MDDFMDLCLRRQSCRSFADRFVEHEKLVRCVEAARLAPSACNSQPWEFVIVEKPDVVDRVAKCTQQLGLNSYISGARAFFIILEDRAKLIPQIKGIVESQTFAKGDIGGAAAYLCLEAESLGIGTCMLGVYDREKICMLVDIPQERRIRALIAAGYPDDPAVRPKARKPLEDVVRFVR